MSLPFLHVLTGPTASGKSELAVRVAGALDAEILSMDSMAVYRRMDLGTAKPTPAQRSGIPHHLIDLVEPWEGFDTARYLEEARRAAVEVASRGRRVLVVGGTPLYLMALRKGLFSGPPADHDLRKELLEGEKASPGFLHGALARVDPAAAARIHPRDLKRLVRALEVHRLTGGPLSARQREFDRPGDLWPNLTVAVEVPREQATRRIKERTQRMFEEGLLDEVRGILAAGGFSKESSQAIGYAQCLSFLSGRLEAARLVPSVVAATRRLLRRQLTWLRRMESVRWLPPEADSIVEAFGKAGRGSSPPPDA